MMTYETAVAAENAARGRKKGETEEKKTKKEEPQKEEPQTENPQKEDVKKEEAQKPEPSNRKPKKPNRQNCRRSKPRPHSASQSTGNRTHRKRPTHELRRPHPRNETRTAPPPQALGCTDRSSKSGISFTFRSGPVQSDGLLDDRRLGADLDVRQRFARQLRLVRLAMLSDPAWHLGIKVGTGSDGW